MSICQFFYHFYSPDVISDLDFVLHNSDPVCAHEIMSYHVIDQAKAALRRLIALMGFAI